MGCLISRPRAPENHRANRSFISSSRSSKRSSSSNGDALGRDDAKRDRKNGRGLIGETELRESNGERRGDNCDYATSKWPNVEEPQQATATTPPPGSAPALISQSSAENINQTTAAQAPNANRPIDLGQCDVGAASKQLASADKRHKMSRRTRKRQRHARGDETGGHGAAASQAAAAGSFLLMFVPGRRHSAMRIDAARGSNTSSIISVPEHLDDHQQVASAPALALNLNFLRAPAASLETGSKQKFNSPASRQQRASSPGSLSNASMLHAPAIEMPNGGSSDNLSSQRSEQSSEAELTLKGTHNVLLFTNLQQLCYEILNRKLRRLLQNGEPKAESKVSRGAAICLFVFSRPGSSKGELAFDLVEHSSLIDLLGNREKLETLVNETRATEEHCPIFHYIDVSALIVANIDERIGDYNRLVARTLRDRRGQLALIASRQESEELDEAASANAKSCELEVRHESSFDSSIKQEGSLDGREDISTAGLNVGSNATASEAKKREGSPEEKEELSAIEQQERRRASLEQQFGIMTLTTKQRSILQLKLMKYANCVTSKWITILIKQEINKLERRLKHLLSEIGQLSSLLARVPPRIYLINLVPNQLSIFKSCLYLEQALSLSDFHRPHYAIKFERRTNIRVLKKERGVKRDEQQGRKLSDPTKSSFQFKLAHIKIPILVSPSLSKSTSHESLVTSDSGSKSAEAMQTFAAASTELLSNATNEKLGPKFNETFAQQFMSCDRLLRVRFNPLDHGSGSDHAESRPSSSARESCCSRLMHTTSCNNTPLASPSPSGLISMFVTSDSRHQQQSSSFEHLNLSPNEPGAERLSGSSSSSLVDLNRTHDNSSMISSTLSGKTTAPKWAIELRLETEPEPNADKTSETSENNSSEGRPSHQNPIEPHTFQPPRSRSPLMFAAADRYQQLLSASRHHQSSENYALVPTRVAYANGTSQTILEVKRTHRRSLKFKSRQDVGKLLKLIERARRQLIEDLDTWLAASIASEAGKLHKLNGDLHQDLGALIPSSKRQPSLVTQVIRIDLSQFRRDQVNSSLPDHTLANSNAATRQTQPGSRPLSAADRLRPSLKVRPASSLSNEESTTNQQQPTNGDKKRHVQFRIDPTNEERGERALLGPIQRRLWINECLFVSCSDVELLACMNNFVELLQ